MIRAEHITKFYGAREAVRDLTFEIESREIVGFLGLNGAGKSTTLRILAGLLAPSHGSVVVDGEDLLGPNGVRVRRRIGFLPERPPVYEDMTVRAFIEFAGRLRELPASKTSVRVSEVIERTGLEPYANEPILNLSHGYRQRVGIAQAIVHDPDLVILDEPTSGLDPIQMTQMRSLVTDLRERHTVLLSSHNLHEITQTCDRLMIIRDGALVASGSERELVDRLGAASTFRLHLVGEAQSALETAVERGLITAFETAGPAFDAVMAGPVEELVRHLVEAGVGVRRVQPKAAELEALFSAITQEKAA
ncbi:MAG: ABC transporter ATP-binding protein [Myxococcota bacterium]